VGFIVYPDELGITGADEELRVPDRAGGEDHALLSFCREYYAAYESGVLSDADIHSALLGYLARHGEVAAMDPILVGKRELERYFDRELRIEHIAEAAGLHPVRFARRFKARFGMSPVSYRLAWRLNHAARLSWAQPTRSIEEIAADCGFNSLPFFHRRFIEQFGMTPAAYGGRR
jgi:AraC-like DNA-binding protein